MLLAHVPKFLCTLVCLFRSTRLNPLGHGSIMLSLGKYVMKVQG